MPSCLTLSIVRLGTWVKWSNSGKGVVPYPAPWCSSYWKFILPDCQVFSQPEWNYLNHLDTVLSLTETVFLIFLLQGYGPIWTYQALITELDNIAHSSVQVSNHTWSEAMHMSAHQLAQYHQLHWVHSMAKIALVRWYICCKLVHTKILQKFDYIQNIVMYENLKNRVNKLWNT